LADAIYAGSVRRVLAAAALGALGAVLAGGACGGEDPVGGRSTAAGGPTGGDRPAAGAATGGALAEPTPPGGPEDRDEARAVDAARGYIEAIDSRRSPAVCNLLAPDALEGLRGVAGPCPEALVAALGRRPAGGAPAWEGTRVGRLVSVQVEGDAARVTLEVLHRFSDRPNPSVEDDVIYLEAVHQAWLVSQPDATLFRAVGYPEPPLRAFTPPAGFAR
jgi:hypothetical protein